MKKIIATTLTALMLAGVALGGAVETASAAPYSMHMQFPTVHHSKHWHQHMVCTVKWRHHHKVRVCFWVPSHR